MCCIEAGQQQQAGQQQVLHHVAEAAEETFMIVHGWCLNSQANCQWLSCLSIEFTFIVDLEEASVHGPVLRVIEDGHISMPQGPELSKLTTIWYEYIFKLCNGSFHIQIVFFFCNM